MSKRDLVKQRFVEYIPTFCQLQIGDWIIDNVLVVTGSPRYAPLSAQRHLVHSQTFSIYVVWSIPGAWPYMMKHRHAFGTLHGLVLRARSCQYSTNRIYRLLGLNASTLLTGVIANVLLLLNFAHVVNYNLAQLATIILWYLSAILLTVLLIVTGTQHHALIHAEHIYGQAFYYGAISAALYFASATLLVFHFWDAKRGLFPSRMNLNRCQLILMTKTILLLIWVAGFAGVFSHIEGWPYVDSIYYCDITILTIGYGDYTPSTTTGRGVFILFNAIGIVLLALVVFRIRASVLDRGKHNIGRQILERGRAHLTVRMSSNGDESLHGNHRDKKAFQALRHVQRVSARTERWFALLASTISFLVFWLIGALVFVYSEKDQGWTYFDGMYFCWTSLSTVGYGDLVVKSTLGKPLFVVWSIFAVPAVTMLFSYVEDTISHELRERTAERAQNKTSSEQARDARVIKGSIKSFDDSHNKQKHSKKRESRRKMMKALCDEDDDILNLMSTQNQTERESLFKHLVLLDRLLGDLGSDPPKKYNFEEWSMIIELLRTPAILDMEQDTYKNQDRQQDSTAEGSKDSSVNAKSNSDSHFLSNNERVQHYIETHIDGWNWLDENSPLLAEREEAQWIIHKVIQKLMVELRNDI